VDGLGHGSKVAPPVGDLGAPRNPPGRAPASNLLLVEEPMIAEVKVYTTTSCAYCIRAKALLKQRNVPFEEVDVTGDDEKRAWLVKASGGLRTVPQIFIDGKPMGGSDELYALDRSGELEKLLHR
jgi:glutaredoxin 3